MELTKGKWKQTEVGLIPEDWILTTIDNIAEVKGGGTPSTTVAGFWNGSINWFTPTEIGYSKYVKESKRKITIEGLNNSSAQILPKGTILLTSRAGIGDLAILKEDSSTNQGFQSLLVKENVSNEFLYYFMAISKNLLLKKASGSTFLEISPNNVRSIRIPLPPFPEQKAIAQVLSDTDTLIQILEQKLAKKRAIKQGAMKQLLTPKEGWEVKKLSNVCWFQEGPGLRNWQFTKKGMKVINVTNLVKGYLNLDKTDRHISLNEFETMYKHFEIDENDIVMASSGNSYSKVAVVRKQDLPLLMNTSVIRFKPLKEIDYNFLLIFLKSKSFKTQIDLLITGGAQPNFGPFHLNRINIDLPSTIDEQRQISNILTDMEFEIEQLEQKLDKYKLLKQGLMQELLTGRIRLV